MTNLSSHLSLISEELTRVKESVANTTPASAADGVEIAAASGPRVTRLSNLHDTSTSPAPAQGASASSEQQLRTSASAGKDHDDARKMNLVVFGLPESKAGTRRQERIREDFEKAGGVLSHINPAISDVSIRDCRRLGKFKDGVARPTLLQLHRSVDVSIILSGRKKLSTRPDIIVKPDLSPSERKVEQLLLKERRFLIESGIQRSDIRIRGSSLYVNNKKLGSVKNNKYEPTEDQLASPHSSKAELTTPTIPTPPAAIQLTSDSRLPTSEGAVSNSTSPNSSDQ